MDSIFKIAVRDTPDSTIAAHNTTALKPMISVVAAPDSLKFPCADSDPVVPHGNIIKLGTDDQLDANARTKIDHINAQQAIYDGVQQSATMLTNLLLSQFLSGNNFEEPPPCFFARTEGRISTRLSTATLNLFDELGLNLGPHAYDCDSSTLMTYDDLGRTMLAYAFSSEAGLNLLASASNTEQLAALLKKSELLRDFTIVEFGGFRAMELAIALGAKPENCACIAPNYDSRIEMPAGVTVVDQIVTNKNIDLLERFIGRTMMVVSNQVVSVGGADRGADAQESRRRIEELLDVQYQLASPNSAIINTTCKFPTSCNLTEVFSDITATRQQRGEGPKLLFLNHTPYGHVQAA